MKFSEVLNKEYFWWSAAFITGALVWSIPSFLTSTSLPGGEMVLGAVLILLLFSMTAGYYKKLEPWKLALISILPIPFIEMISIAFHLQQMADSFSFLKSIPYLVFKIPVYVLQGLPVFIGGYLGVYIGNTGKKTEKIRPVKFQNKIWWLVFAGCFLAGILYNIVKSKEPSAPFPYSLVMILILILITSPFLTAYLTPQKVYRWAVAGGAGFVAAVVCLILIDLIRDSASHNLFPFEIIISCVIAIPCTFAGAYLGRGRIGRNVR